jgi:hypothetical protein
MSYFDWLGVDQRWKELIPWSRAAQLARNILNIPVGYSEPATAIAGLAEAMAGNLLPASTINAGAFRAPGLTKEQIITAAFNDPASGAIARGATAIWLPADLISGGYDITQTPAAANPTIHLFREGGSTKSDEWEPKAYGAKAGNSGDDYNSINTAKLAAINGHGTLLFDDDIYRTSRPALIIADQNGCKVRGTWRTSKLGGGLGGATVRATYAYGHSYVGAGSHVFPTGAALVSGSGSFTTSNTQWLNFREASTMDLDGLSAFTFEGYFKAANAATGGTIVCSCGKWFPADAASSAFSIYTSGGKLGGGMTTSGTTLKFITGTTSLVTGTIYWYAISYDGTTFRLFIAPAGGTISLEGSQAMTGTLKQGVAEDIYFGQGTTTDFSPDIPTITPPGGTNSLLGPIRVSNSARYTAGGGTAPNGTFSLDGNTKLINNFDLIDGPLARGLTNNGDAWFAVRESGTGVAGTQVDVEDMIFDGVGTSCGITGVYLMGACYNPKLNRIRIHSYRYGVNAPQGNIYSYNYSDLYIENTGINEGSFPARYGIVLGSNSGLGHLDTINIYASRCLFYSEINVTINNMFLQCLSDTVLGAFFGCGNTVVNYTVNGLVVNTEAGVNAGWRGGIGIQGAFASTLHMYATFNSPNIEAASIGPNVIVDGVNSVTFNAPSFSFGGGASVFKILNAPKVPIRVNPSGQPAAGFLAWSDVAGAVHVGPIGPKTVTFGASPTFDCALGDYFELSTVLTANITGASFTNVTPGQVIQLKLIQNGAGGFTINVPANMHGDFTLDTAANHFTLFTIRAGLNSASAPDLWVSSKATGA